MTGIERIATERQRQIEVEGWTPEHDDSHENGELAAAAVAYTLHVLGYDETCDALWPWKLDWWKPNADPIRDLEKAGALIAAEIDRRLRARGEK